MLGNLLFDCINRKNCIDCFEPRRCWSNCLNRSYYSDWIKPHIIVGDISDCTDRKDCTDCIESRVEPALEQLSALTARITQTLYTTANFGAVSDCFFALMLEQLSALIVWVTQTSYTTQMSGQFLTVLTDRKDHTEL